MGSEVKCVFCGEVTAYKVIEFTADTLNKCLQVLEYRRNKTVHRKLRTTYSTVQISAHTSLSEGYHSRCYKLFTAVKIPSNFLCLKPHQRVVEYENAFEVPTRNISSADALVDDFSDPYNISLKLIKEEPLDDLVIDGKNIEDVDDQRSPKPPEPIVSAPNDLEFVVGEFREGNNIKRKAIVHKNWLVDRKHCMWPKKISRHLYLNCLKSGKAPDGTWRFYFGPSHFKILYRTNSLVKAEKKLRKIDKNRNLNSDYENPVPLNIASREIQSKISQLKSFSGVQCASPTSTDTVISSSPVTAATAALDAGSMISQQVLDKTIATALEPIVRAISSFRDEISSKLAVLSGKIDQLQGNSTEKGHMLVVDY